MSREPLLELLKEYQPLDHADAATQERFYRFVESEPSCFERSLPIGHVTGSSWLVDHAGARVLLTHHRKLDKWLQLGGHADGDADLLAVALREAEEESGLRGLEPCSKKIFDLDIHEIPARGADPAHLHYDVRFALRTVAAEAYQISDESHDLAWVPIAELERFTKEWSMLRMKQKWRNFGALVLLLAAVIAGGFTPVRAEGPSAADPDVNGEDHVLSAEECGKILKARIATEKLYERWLSPSCWFLKSEKERDIFIDFATLEKHGAGCQGAAEQPTVLDRFRVFRITKQILWYDVAKDEWVAVSAVAKKRKQGLHVE